MKKILLLSLSLITLISCEKTTIEGCTEPMAINYNPRASVNNNSCDFTGDIIFYLDQAAGIYLYNEGVQELTFYIDGNNIGTQYNNGGFYTTQTPPNCFDDFFTTSSVYWSNNSYTTITYPKGIGKRIAERLIVELKNKLQRFIDNNETINDDEKDIVPNQFSNYIDEIYLILNSLGYVDNEIKDSIKIITTNEKENSLLLNSLTAEEKAAQMDKHLKEILMKLSEKST